MGPEVRRPAVAGTFYPDAPGALRREVARCQAGAKPISGAARVLIVPHAGLAYSGEVAASAYAALGAYGPTVRRAIVFGPSHRVAFNGLALSGASRFVTPLGAMPVDYGPDDACLRVPAARVYDEAHALEHCIEVQLPFLQCLFGTVSLAPVVVGDAPPHVVAALMEQLVSGERDALIVSSDLSHYLPDESARRTDARTARRILDGEETLAAGDACGCRAINGLQHWSKNHAVQPHLLDLRNSSDAGGPRDRVVGYGAFAFR